MFVNPTAGPALCRLVRHHNRCTNSSEPALATWHCRCIRRRALGMLHVRQLWARPPAHTGWFKGLISACPQRAAHTGSAECKFSPCVLHHSPAGHQLRRTIHAIPRASLNRHLSSSSRTASPKQRKRQDGGEGRTSALPDASIGQFRVGIFGRPNVGKSTLFNRLVGQRVAITDSTPGVTRDPLHHPASLAGLHFTVIDTAGLEPVQSFLSQPPSPSQLVNKQSPSASLQETIQQQTRRTIRQCHLALFLIDARLPISNEDVQYARMVREEHSTLTTTADGRQQRRRLPVVLVANKVEEGVQRERLVGLDDVYQLGLGEPIEMSAEHGEGLAMLHNVIDQHMQQLAAQQRDALEAETVDDKIDDADASKPVIQMAIVGRPNTGKSTLLNALLQEERALTGPQPGITRDPIRSVLPAASHPLYRFHIVDTAGIRGGVIRRESEARVDTEAMRLSMRAIDRAHVVVLVVDVAGATQLSDGKGQVNKRQKGKEEDEEALLLSKVSGILSQQDLTIAKRVMEEGRGLVLVLNKIDLLDKDDKANVLRGLRLLLDRTLPQVKDVPLIPLSATTTLHLPTLLPAIVWLYTRWIKSIPTARLTSWLLQLQSYRPHPSYKGRRLRFKFMRQVAVRPPTFSVWLGGGGAKGGHGGLDGVSDEWLRMMRGLLCQEFGLEGVNVRLKVKRGEVKDREERRQEARGRDEAEERELVRHSEIEVKDDEEADVEDEEADVEDEEAEQDEAMQGDGGEDVDVHDYKTAAADAELDEDEEFEEEEEEQWNETTEEDDAEPEESLQAQSPRRPHFIPFDQDPDRIAAVAAAASSQSVPASTSSALSASPGFMSPPPSVPRAPTALSHPNYRHPNSRSHLSFLPLPAPSRPSKSLPWSERRLVQQKRTEQRSTAIREMKEQAMFVSKAAWWKWKEGQEERRQRYLRREKKKVAGREKKAMRGRKEQEVVVEGAEDDGEKRESARSRQDRSSRSGGHSREGRRRGERARARG